MKPQTTMIHGGGHTDSVGSLTTPIYETTTYLFDTAAEVKQYAEGGSTRFLYSRYGNPTVQAVERTIAALEGAESALLLSSGQAATTTALLGLLSAGDEVICSSAIYGGTLHLLADLLPKFGIRTRFATLDGARRCRQHPVRHDEAGVVRVADQPDPALRRHRGDRRGLSRPRRDLGDRQHLRQPGQPAADRARGRSRDAQRDQIPERPQRRDRAARSPGPAALLAPIEKARRLIGGILDAHAAYALGRGIKTLHVRVQRHNANAMAVATWLSKDSRVERVYYPGLESHPDHALARKQMQGFGGMVCVDLGDSLERASRFFDRLQVIRRAASLGGIESLCSLPVLTSQWGHTPEELERAGVTEGMARLSIGLEDVEDLIADLDQALA